MSAQCVGLLLRLLSRFIGPLPPCVYKRNGPILIQPEWELPFLKGGHVWNGLYPHEGRHLAELPHYGAAFGGRRMVVDSQVMVEYGLLMRFIPVMLLCWNSFIADVRYLHGSENPQHCTSAVLCSCLCIFTHERRTLWNTERCGFGLFIFHKCLVFVLLLM